MVSYRDESGDVRDRDWAYGKLFFPMDVLNH